MELTIWQMLGYTVFAVFGVWFALSGRLPETLPKTGTDCIPRPANGMLVETIGMTAQEITRITAALDADQKRRAYVFALYRQRVVGVFHVARPAQSLAVEREGGFRDFPDFEDSPAAFRQIDRLKARYATLEDARRGLTPEEYDAVVTNLKEGLKPRETLEHAMSRFQKRIYWKLDDAVPPELRDFLNCVPTYQGSTDFICRGVALYGGPIFSWNLHWRKQ